MVAQNVLATFSEKKKRFFFSSLFVRRVIMELYERVKFYESVMNYTYTNA